MPNRRSLFSRASLRRITTSGNYIPEIDGLRFIAIASVFLFHLALEMRLRSGTIVPIEPRYSGLFHIIGNGDCGVNLFFIVSGFVLALPFARNCFEGAKAVSLRKYFIRRLTRLEPPYLLSVLIFVVLLFAYTRNIAAGVLTHAAVTALYLHRLVFGERTYINPVSWSLEIEVQFYLMAPILMQLFRLRTKLLRRAVLICLIITVSIVQFTIINSPRASESILFYAQFFLIPVADSRYLRRGWKSDLQIVALGYSWIVSLALTFNMTRNYTTTHVVVPWTMALIFGSALRGVVLRRFFANFWIAAIGGMCYSIYLMHFQMIAVFFKLTRKCILPHFDFLGNYMIQLVVTGVPVMFVSLVFYLLIERPCMDPTWPSKFWHRITGRRRAQVQVFDSRTSS